MTRHGLFVGASAATALLLASLLGCGNDFVAGAGGNGGSSSGNGGSSSSSGNGGSSSGSGGGGATPCVDQGECHQEGATCGDGACCPCTYKCQDGVWQMEGCAGCAEPLCPFEIPIDGNPCDRCGPAECAYEQCDGLGQVTASCDGDSDKPTWSLKVASCPAAPPCGAEPSAPPCQPGKLCVLTEITSSGNTAIAYHCADNPCAPAVTTCDCAQSVCAELDAPTCLEASPVELECQGG